MTVLELINRAFRADRILQSMEYSAAEEADDALLIINNMLHEWELIGIPLNHTDLILTDTIPYPKNHLNPIIYNAAMEIAQDYGVGFTSLLVAKASRGIRSLQNYYLDPKPLVVDPAISATYAPNRLNND